jgi:Domain of unknown function (DUF4198)
VGVKAGVANGARTLRCLTLVVLGLWMQLAWAHEFWLMPTPFAPAVGADVGLQLLVGSGWPGESRAYDSARALRFEWIDSSGRVALTVVDGAEPAGRFNAPRAVQAVVLYRSNAAQISLPAAQFEAYLEDEGLQRVRTTRARRGESASAGVERYSRCAKTLLHVDQVTGASTVWQQPVGLTLELTPLGDPQHWQGSRKLVLQAHFRGHAMPGLWVKAMPQNKAVASLGARTNAQGQVVFELPASGVWLFNTVHMFDAPKASGARWESVWSSLTLQLPAASSPP